MQINDHDQLYQRQQIIHVPGVLFLELDTIYLFSCTICICNSVMFRDRCLNHVNM